MSETRSAGRRTWAARARGLFREVAPGQWVTDALLGALFLLLSVAFLPVYGEGFSMTGSIVTALAMVLALMLSRVSPPLSLTTAWLGALFQMSTGQDPAFANFAIFVVLFAAAGYGSRLVFWAAFASSFLGAACIALYLVLLMPNVGETYVGQPTATTGGIVLTLLLLFGLTLLAFLLSWTLGALFRLWLRGVETRKQKELAEARASAEQERGRIARDMHDVVAHSLAVVIAQADGARYAAAADPALAGEALTTISRTARSALSDVRMLLTQLRHSQGDGPQPTVADLDDLFCQVRAAGVDLRVGVEGRPPAELPTGVQIAVYRILQEATTNALRHGDGGPVHVDIAWRAETVELSVRNGTAGRRPAAHTGGVRVAAGTTGHGLVGMRERAELVGGRLDARAEGAGWVLRALLPTAPDGDAR